MNRDRGSIPQPARRDPQTTEQRHDADNTVINARWLWSGGVATAVVAAGVTVVGFLAVRGLLGFPVLGLRVGGRPPAATVTVYAVGAAVSALLATAVMHLLLLTNPRPRLFFGWIGSVATAVVVLAPLTVAQTWDVRLSTAALNLLLGVCITTLVSATAAVSSDRA